MATGRELVEAVAPILDELVIVQVFVDDDVPVVETDTSSDSFAFSAFGYSV